MLRLNSNLVQTVMNMPLQHSLKAHQLDRQASTVIVVLLLWLTAMAPAASSTNVNSRDSMGWQGLAVSSTWGTHQRMQQQLVPPLSARKLLQSDSNNVEHSMSGTGSSKSIDQHQNAKATGARSKNNEDSSSSSSSTSGPDTVVRQRQEHSKRRRRVRHSGPSPYFTTSETYTPINPAAGSLKASDVPHQLLDHLATLDEEQPEEAGQSKQPDYRFTSYVDYGDYVCLDPGYNCDYYDYGSNIEGTGELGVLMNLLLFLINDLSFKVPRLGARARADTLGRGQSLSSRRNTTSVVQNNPDRTGGLYIAGTVTTDPTDASATSAGTSQAVAKNIVSPGTPVNNFASAGSSFVASNSSSFSDTDAAARALVGGLAVAGQRAVISQTGNFFVGPVITIFTSGNRNGATSQNGAAAQTIGTNSSTYLQSSALAVVNLGDPEIAKDVMKGGTTPGDKKGPGDKGLEEGGDYEDNAYYYYDNNFNKDQQNKRNAGGAVTKGWMTHQDLADFPNPLQPWNTRGEVQSFGAVNIYAWTRGVSTASLVSFGTRSAASRVRGGAFGTGASTISSTISSATVLQKVLCAPPIIKKHREKNQTTEASHPKDKQPLFPGSGPGNAAMDTKKDNSVTNRDGIDDDSYETSPEDCGPAIIYEYDDDKEGPIPGPKPLPADGPKPLPLPHEPRSATAGVGGGESDGASGSSSTEGDTSKRSTVQGAPRGYRTAADIGLQDADDSDLLTPDQLRALTNNMFFGRWRR